MTITVGPSGLYGQMMREDAAAAWRVRQSAGEYVAYAENAVETLLTAVASYKQREMVFKAFHLHAKKSAALAYLSAMHLHRVQMYANLRQLCESSSHLAYFAHHADVPPELSKPGADAGELFAQNVALTKRAHAWMTKTYPDHSGDFLAYKKKINNFAAHATVFTTGMMLDLRAGDYLDQYSDVWSEVDTCLALHLVGQISVLVSLLLLRVSRDTNVFEVHVNLNDRLAALNDEGQRLREALQSRLDV